MKKIFVITAHRVTNSLLWTIEYLSQFKDNTIILHYDLKSDIEDISNMSFRSNVYLSDERIDVQWGRFSQVEATLSLLKQSLKYDYDYLFFISGDDIPSISNTKMNTILRNNAGAEFIHFQDGRNSYVDPMPRVKYKYPNFYVKRNNSFSQKVIKKISNIFIKLFLLNKNFHDLKNSGVLGKLYKGTNWFTLTKSSVVWLVEYINKNPNLLTSFKYSIFIDEVFFHTILAMKENLIVYNDKSKINNCLRYIDWETGPDYPRLIDANDLNKILKSECFFCRKINQNLSNEEFNKIKHKLVL